MSLSTQSNEQKNPRKNYSKKIFELVLFSMLGSLMFTSKIIMEMLPNIHLLGMFTMVFTIVFRVKALIPIYIYVMLNGIYAFVYAGSWIWWIPYLYIWAVLWGITMMLPKNMPKNMACIVYPVVCALHGLFFGTLYAPAQAIMFGLSFKQTIAWIISGLPFDIVHAIGDFCAGLLILPLSELLKKLMKR